MMVKRQIYILNLNVEVGKRNNLVIGDGYHTI